MSISTPIRFGLLALCSTLAACSHLTPPKQSAAKLIEQSRSSIVTSYTVSALTRTTLINAGFNQESCMADFQQCIQGVQEATFEHNRHQNLSVLAELYYTRAQNLLTMDACRTELDRPPIDPYYANAPKPIDEINAHKQAKIDCTTNYREALYQSLRYSYAYLFYPELTGATRSASFADETEVRTQDLYHLTVNDIITQMYRSQSGAFGDAKEYQYDLNQPTTEPAYNQVLLASLSTKQANHITKLIFSIENNPYYLAKIAKGRENTFSEFVSAYDSRLSKLDASSRRSGLGVGFVGSMQDRYTASISQKLDSSQPKPTPEDPQYLSRIHQIGHVLVTALIIPEGDTVEQVLNSQVFHAYLFDPLRHKTVTILGSEHPLSANFSAGYALWLSENQLQPLSIINMLSKQENMTLPDLFMLEPYDPNKQVIIMLHGLASSPATWVNLTNTLLSDPVLGSRYQVWQIAYSTNLPILENRYQIARLIEAAFASVDPSAQDTASRHAMLIGHSMGGVISRLLVSNDDLTKPLSQLDTAKEQKLIASLSPDQQYALESRLKFERLPQVDEAIFISAPFRGTDYADRWFTRAARRIIHLPIGLTQRAANALANLDNNNPDGSVISSLYLQNGASQLSDRSAFMALTKDVSIDPVVRYHTIVGDHKGINANQSNQAIDTVSDKISDGIVPYSSSHLDGATSETIITGSHNIHENPKTILQLRKILYAHLEK